MSSTKGRRGVKMDKPTSKKLMKEVAIHVPDMGNHCPPQAEGFIATQVVNWNKYNALMAKLQPEMQKLIKIQFQEILESLDPANIGKSREIKIPNPQFDANKERTDTDEEPFSGDNAFWMKSYESVWDRNRFRPNVIEDMKKTVIGANKDIIQKVEEALKDIHAQAAALEKAKEEYEEKAAALGEVEDNTPLISLDYEEPTTVQ